MSSPKKAAVKDIDIDILGKNIYVVSISAGDIGPPLLCGDIFRILCGSDIAFLFILDIIIIIDKL